MVRGTLASLNYHSLLLVTRCFKLPSTLSLPAIHRSVERHALGFQPFSLFAALITRQQGFVTVGNIVRSKTFKIDGREIKWEKKGGGGSGRVRIEIFQFAWRRIFFLIFYFSTKIFNLESKLISMMRESSLSLTFFFFFLKKRKLTRALELRY